MKFVFYGLMIPLAFILGKILYEPFFGGEEWVSADDSESVVEIQVKSKMGTVTEVVDYHEVDPKDFPEKVTIAQEVILTDKNGLSPLKLAPGSPVKPLSLIEMVLEVTSPMATHLTGEIPVVETNFAKAVANKRMSRRMAMLALENGDANPAPTPEQPAAPAKEVAAVTPAPTPKMAEPAPAPESEPAPEPEPEAPTSLTAEQIVAAMKESLESGSIKELDASKVMNWEAGEDESFDGEDFQVGIATYKEMTILGEKTLQAKALFQEGELDKWIHAKTGMEIR